MISRVVLVACVAAACGREATVQRPAAGSGAPAVANATAGGTVGNVAAHGPIALAVTAAHGELALTFTNTSSAPMKVATHVFGGAMDHLDWLTVELEDQAGARRTLHFIDDREESGLVTADLAPGASTTERADLVRWSISGGNDRPIAPGTYQLRATWDASRETTVAAFVATATTTLVVDPPGAACATDHYKAPAGAKPVLLGHQLATGRATVELGLYNAGDAPLCVYSHIQTHEIQNDWLTVVITDGALKGRPLSFDDSREKSYPVSVLLPPGATVWQTFDLDAWAQRRRNGGVALGAGAFFVEARWNAAREDEVWSGSVRADAFHLSVK